MPRRRSSRKGRRRSSSSRRRASYNRRRISSRKRRSTKRKRPINYYIRQDPDISSDGAEFIHAVLRKKPTLQNLDSIALQTFHEGGYAFGSEFDYAVAAIRNYLLQA